MSEGASSRNLKAFSGVPAEEAEAEPAQDEAENAVPCVAESNVDLVIINPPPPSIKPPQIE